MTFPKIGTRRFVDDDDSGLIVRRAKDTEKLIAKYNPNHDRLGRFSHGRGGRPSDMETGGYSGGGGGKNTNLRVVPGSVRPPGGHTAHPIPGTKGKTFELTHMGAYGEVIIAKYLPKQMQARIGGKPKTNLDKPGTPGGIDFITNKMGVEVKTCSSMAGDPQAKIKPEEARSKTREARQKGVEPAVMGLLALPNGDFHVFLHTGSFSNQPGGNFNARTAPPTRQPWSKKTSKTMEYLGSFHLSQKQMVDVVNELRNKWDFAIEKAALIAKYAPISKADNVDQGGEPIEPGDTVLHWEQDENGKWQMYIYEQD
jgi:hypothetical protein